MRKSSWLLSQEHSLLKIASSYDMYRDIEEKLAAKKQAPYTGKFLCGLPIGLELPNGIVIGASA